MLKHSFPMVLSFCLALACLVLPGVTSAVDGVALDVGSIVTINKAKCGYINGVWTPGTLRKNGIFLPTASNVAAVAKSLKNKKLSAAKKQKIKAKLKKLRRTLKANARLCATIGAGGGTPTPGPTPAATPATPLPNATTVAWNVSASNIASDLGGEYLFFCPSNPTAGLSAIYGHDTYTSDSPICVAAVHVGLFKRGIGGNVRLRIKGAQNFYRGSVRNGIQSNFYGAYPTSYVFLDLGSGGEIITNTIPEISFSQDAAPMISFLEQTFSFVCTSGIGKIDSIWGTDLYTYDSSICTAAVHAGRISLANGGVVTIQIKPGALSYNGSTRNGITSSSYGPWSGSFIFVP